MGRNWHPPRAVLESNLYFHALGKPVTFAGMSFQAWQAAGMDAGSLVADPRFRDPEAGDFRLRPGSPAPKLGFEPFDLADVGPRCDGPIP